MILKSGQPISPRELLVMTCTYGQEKFVIFNTVTQETKTWPSGPDLACIFAYYRKKAQIQKRALGYTATYVNM